MFAGWIACTGGVAAAPLPAAGSAAVDAATGVSALDDASTPRWSSMPELAPWRRPAAPPDNTAVRPRAAVVDRLGWAAAAPDPGPYALFGAVLLALALVARRRRP